MASKPSVLNQFCKNFWGSWKFLGDFFTDPNVLPLGCFRSMLSIYRVALGVWKLKFVFTEDRTVSLGAEVCPRLRLRRRFERKIKKKHLVATRDNFVPMQRSFKFVSSKILTGLIRCLSEKCRWWNSSWVSTFSSSCSAASFSGQFWHTGEFSLTQEHTLLPHPTIVLASSSRNAWSMELTIPFNFQF